MAVMFSLAKKCFPSVFPSAHLFNHCVVSVCSPLSEALGSRCHLQLLNIPKFEKEICCIHHILHNTWSAPYHQMVFLQGNLWIFTNTTTSPTPNLATSSSSQDFPQLTRNIPYCSQHAFHIAPLLFVPTASCPSQGHHHLLPRCRSNLSGTAKLTMRGLLESRWLAGIARCFPAYSCVELVTYIQFTQMPCFIFRESFFLFSRVSVAKHVFYHWTKKKLST